VDVTSRTRRGRMGRSQLGSRHGCRGFRFRLFRGKLVAKRGFSG
jgi:hypothetical protein